MRLILLILVLFPVVSMAVESNVEIRDYCSQMSSKQMVDSCIDVQNKKREEVEKMGISYGVLMNEIETAEHKKEFLRLMSTCDTPVVASGDYLMSRICLSKIVPNFLYKEFPHMKESYEEGAKKIITGYKKSNPALYKKCLKLSSTWFEASICPLEEMHIYFVNNIKQGKLNRMKQSFESILEGRSKQASKQAYVPVSLNIHDVVKLNDTEQLKELINNGVNLEKRNREGDTPLNSAIFAGSLESIEVLIANGVDVDGTGQRNGYTPLMFAVLSGQDSSVARLLIKSGARINSQEKLIGTTVLSQAAGKGELEVVKLLLENGADIELASKSGWTPLHEAASSGHIKVVKLLLSKGANPNAKAKYRGSHSFTALQIAEKNNHQGKNDAVIKYLKGVKDGKETVN